MKARETHAVLLSAPVVALFRKRWRERTSDKGLVFSNNDEKPVSDMIMTKLLRDDGIKGATVHGFRSDFTDWAAEKTRFPKEVADKALAHQYPTRSRPPIAAPTFLRIDANSGRNGPIICTRRQSDDPKTSEHQTRLAAVSRDRAG